MCCVLYNLALGFPFQVITALIVPNRAIRGVTFLAAVTKSSLISTADQFSTTIRKINRAMIGCEEASSKALVRAILFIFYGCWMAIDF